jgi:hypothetical protein
MVEVSVVGGIAICLVLAGCRNEPDQGDSGGDPDPCVPVADAGADQSALLGASVTLDASASQGCDAEGQATAVYHWSFETRPAGSALTSSAFSENGSPAAQSTSFTPDELGTWVLALQVSQGDQRSDLDILVIEVGTSGSAPIADCGGDLEVLVGALASLDGSGSYDPDGSALGYVWELMSAPEGSAVETVFDPYSEQASIVPDLPGFYALSLVVFDEQQSSDPSYCTVTAVSPDHPPVADAGEGGALGACEGGLIQLDGFGSFDPEGQALSYRWSIVETPEGSEAAVGCPDSGDACYQAFDDSTAPDARFTWDLEGVYTLQLEVNDGAQWSAPDVVNWEITAC